jgi:hypothetical protein
VKKKIVDPYVLHDPKSNELCDTSRLIKETFIAISHTFSRDTTNPYMPFVPIPISTHPTVQWAAKVLHAAIWRRICGTFRWARDLIEAQHSQLFNFVPFYIY